MKIEVDLNVCGRHGLCCSTAPEVFRLDEAGLLVYAAEPAESSRMAVEQAADDCPTQAIDVQD